MTHIKRKRPLIMAPQNELTDMSCLLQSVPAMIYTYTVNNDTGECNFPFVSNYCEEIFGFPPSKIENDTEEFVNRVHPDDANEFAASVLHSMKTMMMWDHKMRMKAASGDMIYIHGKSLPHLREVMNDDGTFTQLTVWHGTLFDITSTHIESEAYQFQKCHDKSVPCFEVDKDGIIKHWNANMTELTGGILERDVRGQSLKSLVSDSNQGMVQTFLAAAKYSLISPDDEGDVDMEEGEKRIHHYSKDLALSTKTGTEVYLSIQCHAQRETSRLSCTCEDITLIKAAEKEKMDALKLLDAEKKLSEWLSHEIRNPLTIAMEAAKSLNEFGSDSHIPVAIVEGETSYVDLIIQSISYVVDLMSNILDSNKLAAGKILLRPSICALTEDIIQPIQEMISVKNNNVSISFSGEEKTILIDKLRLKQVITNLLSNAIKFTKDGFIKIESHTTTQDVDGSEIPESLVISVSDTGPGVPEKYHTRLFSKFEQLGSTANGTGIGLYFSRILVMAMKGELFLNEKYDSGIEGSPGAQFTVRFPIDVIKVDIVKARNDRDNINISAYNALSTAVKATNNKIPKKSRHKPQNGLSSISTFTNNDSYITGAYRILIVDDDKLVRKLLKRRMSRIFPQATIDEVDCGEKAIECTSCSTSGCSLTSSSPQEQKKSSNIYDIVFMDHIMGEGLTGDQTIKELRNNNVDSLIVGISGNSEEKSHVSAGAEDFFQKPLPSQSSIIQRLVQKLAPPAGWRVLIVDDVKLNCHFLERRLNKISSAHFTTMEQAQKRWSICKTTRVDDAITKIKTERFDLIVLDQELNDDRGMKGTDIAAFTRKHGLNKNCIVALNSASSPDLFLTQSPELLNLTWSKPLPSEDWMRQSLCEELIRQKDDVEDKNRT